MINILRLIRITGNAFRAIGTVATDDFGLETHEFVAEFYANKYRGVIVTELVHSTTELPERDFALAVEKEIAFA